MLKNRSARNALIKKKLTVTKKTESSTSKNLRRKMIEMPTALKNLQGEKPIALIRKKLKSKKIEVPPVEKETVVNLVKMNRSCQIITLSNNRRRILILYPLRVNQINLVKINLTNQLRAILTELAITSPISLERINLTSQLQVFLTELAITNQISLLLFILINQKITRIMLLVDVHSTTLRLF